MPHFLNSKLSLVFLSSLAISVLIFLAHQHIWRYHLEVDIWGFYYPRFQHFIFNNFSFEGIGENEYLPGALIFFLIPGIALTVLNNTWQNYLIGLFLVNIVLIIIHLKIYQKYHVLSHYLFLAILVCAGPIILYRHELFVSLFVLISIILWRKKKHAFSMFLVGLATTIKIYPILFVPYLLLITFKNKGYAYTLKLLAYFILGITSLIFVYNLIGTREEILSALQVNSIKPLHAESIWATITTIFYRIFEGYWIQGKGDHGIFGIHPNYWFASLQFYNYFWVLPLGTFYVFILTKLKKIKKPKLEVEAIFLILLLFIVFSKILTPQYILWFVLLLPLFDLRKNINFLNKLAIVSILLILLITQYLYPIKYSELLGNFFRSGTSQYLFYLLATRNFLLIFVFLIVFINYNKKYLDKNE